MGQNNSKLSKTAYKHEGQLQVQFEDNAIERSLISGSRKLDSMIEQMSDRPSLGKMIDIFGSLHSNPDWEGLTDAFVSISDVIKDIFQLIDTLDGFVDKTEIDNIYAILNQFKELLNTTKKTVIRVSEQAKIQQINLQALLQNMDCLDYNTSNKNNNNKFNKYEFNESIYTLSQWMSDKAIDKIISQWNQFCVICQQTESRWRDIINKSKKKLKSNDKHCKVIRALGALALVSGIAVIVIGLPFIGIASGGMCLAVVIGGSVLAIGGAVGIYYANKKQFDVKTRELMNECIKKSEKVKSIITALLMAAAQFDTKLNKINGIKNDQIQVWLDELKDKESRRMIRNATDKITTYLIEYQVGSDKIIGDIKNTEKLFIDVWANVKL